MKAWHLRSGRDMKLGNALTFMANERVTSEGAVAGDIIGIYNHGQLQIGDTLSNGDELAFKGIPYFAPELFRAARPDSLSSTAILTLIKRKYARRDIRR